ncbi:MAG: ABC transporter permease [Spirochaetaceae bacterium]|jgi:sulfonate transport system permease protein|nr:ABC transporter permease [Spirochaetaceae bacterium]
MKNTGLPEEKHFFTDLCLPVLFPVLVLILWEQLSSRSIINPVILPPPSRIFEAFRVMLLDGQIARHLRASAFRVLWGFTMGSTLGLAAGIVVGISHRIDRATTLIISVLRPIPMIALIPLFILLLGIDEASKIAVITMGAFWPAFMNMVYGIKSVDKKLLELAYVLKKSRWNTLMRIVMPAALPPVFVGLRLGAGSAWACVVAAEMIAASSGIGFLVMFAREVSQTGIMFMGVLLIGLFGLFIDLIIQWVERQVLRWNYPPKKAR